jgi:ectoine hydroxylase-related dioxygenase (phytanoyl-CoA dioxygenase family)
MSDKFYGIQAPRSQLSGVDTHLEELSLAGYSVLPDALPAEVLAAWRQRIDTVYEAQVTEFGEERLSSIGETDICRAPLLYDGAFIDLVMNPKILEVVSRILGSWFILNLQNAIINRPGREHHQSAWHRDLPHQNWTISRPLAIGALFVIDEFTKTTGATMFLPASHRNETIPSQSWIEKYGITLEAPAGSAILFDAMVFHRAGVNRSKMIRRAVNHLYSVPIMKQQYDFPRALAYRSFDDPEVLKILGYTSQTPLDVSAWRNERLRRKGSGQSG